MRPVDQPKAAKAARRRPKVRLRAIGWDHDRCMRPMLAAGRRWTARNPDVEIEWVARSGGSFAEQPLEEVAPDFDLLVIDHPFVGSAHATRCLLPFDELLSGEQLDQLAHNAIGPTHASYEYAGHQWGLATDAACHVSALRPDLMSPCAEPRTWEDVLEFAREAPGSVALSLSVHDAICCFLTLCANAGKPAPVSHERFSDPAIGRWALKWLHELAGYLAPDVYELTPPTLLELMTRSDRLVYAPLVFGYTDYSRPDVRSLRRRIRFGEIPSTGQGPVGSTLGGAGLAVSATSGHPVEAAEFAAWASGHEAQIEVVFPNGGQPGSRNAWLDADLDAASGGFFSGTRATIEAAYVRPRDAWWPGFQRDGGVLVRRCLQARGDIETTLDELEDLYRMRRALEVGGEPLAETTTYRCLSAKKEVDGMTGAAPVISCVAGPRSN